MTVALPATIYAANVAEAKVFLKGSVNAEVSDFINAFASTQAGTKTESIVLMSNPAAAEQQETHAPCPHGESVYNLKGENE